MGIISQAPTTIVATTADLVTTKIGSATETVGRTVSYTISTVNNGPNTANNVTITDSIVPGLTIVSLSNGTYDPISGIVTFSPVASLASGAPAAITNTVSFIAPPDASVSNTARSTSSTYDPISTNNDGSESGAKVTTTLTPTPTPNQPPVTANAQVSIPPNSSTLVTGLGGSDPDGSIAFSMVALEMTGCLATWARIL